MMICMTFKSFLQSEKLLFTVHNDGKFINTPILTVYMDRGPEHR